jgi:hypothetical protein
MIRVDFRTKKNGVPILSKDEIEYIAEAVLRDYKPELLDNPGVMDVEHFSECYASLEMDYKDLTHDHSILGMTVFNNCYIPVYEGHRGVLGKQGLDRAADSFSVSFYLRRDDYG